MIGVPLMDAPPSVVLDSTTFGSEASALDGVIFVNPPETVAGLLTSRSATATPVESARIELVRVAAAL